MASKRFLEAAERLIELEEEHRNYRNPVKFLKEQGFPEDLGDLIDVDLDEMEKEGFLESRPVNTEATVTKDNAIDHEFKEVKYYSFTEELLDKLDYSFEEEGEASETEKEFLKTLEKVEKNNATRGVPVSVIQALRPGEEGLDVEKSFEEPLKLLESLNRKGLVKIESESRGRLSRDFFYSEKLDRDVFTLSVIDRVHISD